MRIMRADFNNGRHIVDIKEGCAAFAEHAGRSDILPDVSTEEGRNNLNLAIDRLLDLPGVVIFLSYHEGRCVGGVGILVTPYIFDYSRMMADELAWWSHDGAPSSTGVGLLLAVRDHIKNENVAFATFHSLMNSPAAIPKIYQRLGLTQLQSTYAGVLN